MAQIPGLYVLKGTPDYRAINYLGLPSSSLPPTFPPNCGVTSIASPQLSPLSTMAPWIQWPIQSDDVSSLLNAAIAGLTLGKEIAAICPPAKTTISSVLVLLDMVNVCSLLIRDDETLVYVDIENHVERQGLCQHRAILRSSMRSHRTRVRRERTRGDQPECAQGNRPTEEVS